VHGDLKIPCKETCSICKATFTDIISFYKHRRDHANQKGRFKCSLCDKTFSTKQTLRYHERDHGGHSYDCTHPGCNRSYNKFMSYRFHISNAHESSKNECRECQQIFSSRARLTKHKALNHPELFPYRNEFNENSYDSEDSTTQDMHNYQPSSPENFMYT